MKSKNKAHKNEYVGFEHRCEGEKLHLMCFNWEAVTPEIKRVGGSEK